MSNREIGPRVRGSYNAPQDDVDIQAFIERTPKTNEQLTREKPDSTWEYNVWMIVIIGVIVLLLALLLWFIFKKDIGPVPGIMPDNPAVVGTTDVKNYSVQSQTNHQQPQTTHSQSQSAQSQSAVLDTLPDISSDSVINRLTSNFGLEQVA